MKSLNIYRKFVLAAVLAGIGIVYANAADNFGIDRNSLPQASPDAQIILNLVSNQQKTTFKVDGNVMGEGRRMYVLVPNRPLTITAKPEGYIEKEEFIQPPYRDYAQIGFFFLREDREGALPPGYQDAIKAITEGAEKICQTAPLNSGNQQLSLDGQGRAELNGVINKVVGLGVSGAAKYQSGNSYGVLQSQLAGAIADGNQCRLKAAELLKSLLK